MNSNAILVLAVLALMLSSGCTLTIAPSVKLQIGGSDARVCVNNEQRGLGNSITKETPIQARVDAPTSMEAQGVP